MYPTKEEMLKQINSFEGKYILKKYNIKRRLFKISKDKTVFFFGKVNDLDFWVKEYYAYHYAEKIEILDNVLNNKKNTNYKVYFNINEIERIYNMNILYGNEIRVCDYLFSDILGIGTHGQIYNNCIAQNIDISKESEIFQEIIKAIHVKEKKAMKYLYEEYIKEFETYQALNNIICWNYRFNNFNDSMKAVHNAYIERDNTIKEILGLPLNMKLKNSSELTLYKIVKDVFEDAIYQYRTEWLGKQSIDIFIPSRQIAIEYQGQQHFEPINFFGGKESFIRQQENDNRKKKLCIEHNIILIEWKYNENISTEKLIIKLKEKNLLM